MILRFLRTRTQVSVDALNVTNMDVASTWNETFFPGP
jgi:hypothetical protein